MKGTHKIMVTRPLTSGEITLARNVFGDAIAYDKVQISDGQFVPLQPKGMGMAPNGNLFMYECYQADYSALPPWQQAHFIHEMVHVWQYQNKVLDPIVDFFKLSLKHRFDYAAAYRYKLTVGRDLLDYNMEQQATIVQDYFLRNICGHPRDTGRCQNEGGTTANPDLFKSVLAKFLVNPGYVRPGSPASESPKPPAA